MVVAVITPDSTNRWQLDIMTCYPVNAEDHHHQQQQQQ
jgi:hypothetical protein